MHLLRYIPVSATGQRGNITYIYVYILDNNCTPTACGLINNVGFESSTTCGTMGSTNPTVRTDCWSPYLLTPDVLQRNCNNVINGWNNLFGIPSTFFSTPAADSWNGNPNNTFLGLFSGGTGHWNESMQTSLNTPIVSKWDLYLEL
ncbi:MAG: hypothetical protein IPG89_07410 [Bacteroidetes bacterium]|nr:hypothetical protein [Bacteroidota bacterium]